MMRSFHGTASAIVLSALALSGCAGQPDHDEAVAEAQAANVSGTTDPGGPDDIDPTSSDPGAMPTFASPPGAAAPYPPTGTAPYPATGGSAPYPTTGAGPYPATGGSAAPGSTCACVPAGSTPTQGLPEQGVATAPLPPAQGVPTQGVPTQGVPAQGGVPVQGGLPIGGVGIGGGAIPIVSGGCCCLPENIWLAAWFAGPPLCMRL